MVILNNFLKIIFCLGPRAEHPLGDESKRHLGLSNEREKQMRNWVKVVDKDSVTQRAFDRSPYISRDLAVGESSGDRRLHKLSSRFSNFLPPRLFILMTFSVYFFFVLFQIDER
jgi:hypothetical protein